MHADEHAGAMTMHMTRDGAFLRREGPESEPSAAYRAPKSSTVPCVGIIRARRANHVNSVNSEARCVDRCWCWAS